MANQVVFRFEKLKTVSDVSSRIGHDMRERPPANANPQGEVVKIVNGLEGRPFLDRLDGIVRKKDSVLAVDALLSASPEYFGGRGFGEWDPSKVESFRSAGEAFFRREFGDRIVSLSYHLDEKTPHFHCIFIPEKDGKFNAKAILGGRSGLRMWQDKAAKAVKHLGLRRGVQGSRAKHSDLSEFYEMVDAPVEKLPENATREEVDKFVETAEMKARYGDFIKKMMEELKRTLQAKDDENHELKKKLQEKEQEIDYLKKVITVM